MASSVPQAQDDARVAPAEAGDAPFAASDVYAAFRAQADARPDAVGIVFEGETRTFAQLSHDVDAAAAWLLEHGHGHGSRIAWWGRNHPEFVALLLACARVGAVLAVINWRLADREIAAILADCAPRHVIVTPEFASRAPQDALVAGTGSLRADLPCVWPAIEADAPFLQLYTSGTTGLPKGVPQTHRNHLAAYRAWTGSGFGRWGTDDRCLICLPLFHAIGSGFTLFSLLQGASAHILGEFSLPAVAEALGGGTITRLPLVPTMIDMLCGDPAIAAQDHRRLRQIYYGGSGISRATLDRAIAVFGCDFAQCYAATETTAAGTCLAPQDHRGDDALLRSCGRPMAGVSLRIVDADGSDVRDGDVGEIALRGANVAAGYWNRPVETAKVFRGGWYLTGDAGFRDAYGFVTIVDRTRDMMISGGENVYPSEVEAALATHDAIAEVAAFGAPDPRWGHRIVAAIVPAAGRDAPPLEALRLHLEPLIARYKHPRQIVVVDALPRNPTGKLLRQPLIERAVQEWPAA